MKSMTDGSPKITSIQHREDNTDNEDTAAKPVHDDKHKQPACHDDEVSQHHQKQFLLSCPQQQNPHSSGWNHQKSNYHSHPHLPLSTHPSVVVDQ
jgi:hypothetical protein